MCIIILIFKIPLDKPNNNYCKGVSHKPSFVGLLNECDGDVTIIKHGRGHYYRHGQVSK